VKNIFKVEDLRNKLFFTMLMILVYRFGSAIRVPGVDSNAVAQLREAANSQGALGFLNLFSGGAFGSFSIFALGIMPYITSSIIMQVLNVVIPKLQEWQEMGAVGQRKITQWTRYVAIAIALLQGSGLTFIFGQGNGSAFIGAAAQAPDVVLLDPFMPRALLVIPSLVAGTALLMWIGELISQRGISNGMSVLIFASVVAGLPYSYYSILQSKKFVVFGVLVLVSLGILAAVVRVELGQRRIPVQFAKRVVHSVEGQPGRNCSHHFRIICSIAACFVLEHVGKHRGLAWINRNICERLLGEQPEPRLHRVVLLAHHRVRLLL
jgi:preprotein translocase subunit SecY